MAKKYYVSALDIEKYPYQQNVIPLISFFFADTVSEKTTHVRRKKSTYLRRQLWNLQELFTPTILNSHYICK